MNILIDVNRAGKRVACKKEEIQKLRLTSLCEYLKIKHSERYLSGEKKKSVSLGQKNNYYIFRAKIFSA